MLITILILLTLSSTALGLKNIIVTCTNNLSLDFVAILDKQAAELYFEELKYESGLDRYSAPNIKGPLTLEIPQSMQAKIFHLFLRHDRVFYKYILNDIDNLTIKAPDLVIADEGPSLSFTRFVTNSWKAEIQRPQTNPWVLFNK